MSAGFSALTGWLLFGGLALSIGATIARWSVLPRVSFLDDPSPEWLDRGAARVAFYASLLLPVAMAFYFARQLQEFRDPFVPWTEDAALLLGSTAWGRAWLWATAGSIAAVATLFLARTGRRIGWWLATPVVLAMGSFPGFTGHAAGQEALRSISLLADAVHVWAAGGWVGGLTVVLYLEWCWRRADPQGRSLLPELVPAFSPVAMACVGTLVLTGTFAAWRELPDVAALAFTGYGRTLLLKLALVAVVLGLGGLNFRYLTPRLGTQAGNTQLRRAATVELLVAQLVLIVTAVLVRTSPMDH